MYEIYTVLAGDTVDSVAKKFGTTKSELEKLNGNLDNMTSGINIVVPKVENEFFETYTIKKGDNLYNIAKLYNINEELLAGLNGLNKNDYIYPNQKIVIPQKNVRLYITGEGDTLESVINGLKANGNTFLKQNNRIFLYPGQLLLYKEN